MHALDSPLHASDAGSQIGTLQSTSDDDKLLEIFPTNLVLRRKALDIRQCPQRCSMAGGAIKHGVFDRIKGRTVLVSETDANRIGLVVGDQRLGCRKAVKNRSGLLRDLSWSKAKVRRDRRIYLKICRWPANRVVNSVFDVH